MLIESKGIVIDQFFIPPFTLEKGELVILFLYGGGHYYDLELKLKNILSRKDKTDSITFFHPLWLAQSYEESKFRRIFFPITVGKYIEKYANPRNNIAESVYRVKNIDKETTVKTLSTKARKTLDVYVALSHSNYIIFDINGLSAPNVKEVFDIVKETVAKGGAAILIDKFGDLKEECTKFISVETI